MTQNTCDQIHQPIREHDTSKLPSAVTFFVTSEHRQAILKALQPISQNRSQAIMIALGLIEST